MMMNVKRHPFLYNWSQHGTRLVKDPLPVMALADLYLYSLQYDQYISSSRSVKISIALKDHICGMNFTGMENSLTFSDEKQEKWRAIALLRQRYCLIYRAWRGSHNVWAGGTGDWERFKEKKKKLEKCYFMVMDLLRCCHIDINTTWTHATLSIF